MTASDCSRIGVQPVAEDVAARLEAEAGGNGGRQEEWDKTVGQRDETTPKADPGACKSG